VTQSDAVGIGRWLAASVTRPQRAGA
jgi:hypothetical protein